MKSIIDLPTLLTKKLHTAALIGVLCLLAFLGAKAQPYQPTGGILYVNQQVGDPGGDGSSWDSAIPELADALKWAKENENSWTTDSPLKIYVAKGTYKPMYSPADNNFGNNGGRNNSFLLVNNVQLYGGFVGDEDELDGSADDLASRNFENNKTTLSGDLDGDGTLNGGNAYHVVVSVGTVRSALLDGFVISGGNTDGASTILTVNEQSVDWDRGGGGMFNNDSSPILTNMTVSGNRAYYGGGMCNLISSPVLTNVTVSGNSAAEGGGMFNDDSFPVLTNVTVSGNRAGGSGGGMFNKDSSPILTNVTVSGNWAGGSGGGIYNASSSPKIYNSVVWANGTSAIQGANIDGNSSHNLIEGGHASNIEGYKDGTAGLEADDIFERYVAATTEPTTAGDFRLKAGSPAINKGDNDLYEAADDDEDNLGKDTDLAGNPRVHNQTDGGIIDIGAFESPYAPISPTDGILYVNIHVNDGKGPDDVSSDQSGSSWENAIPELADALQWARENESSWNAENPLKIYVAKGTYQPKYLPAGIGSSFDPRDYTFGMVNHVSLYGGFDPENGIANLGDQRVLPDPNPNGSFTGTMLSGLSSYDIPVYHVVTAFGESGSDQVNFMLDGFTVSGGKANGTESNRPFDAYEAYQGTGAGVYLIYANARLNNVKITGNQALEGAGISIAYSGTELTLHSVSVCNNRASGYAAGIHSPRSNTGMIRNSLIANNQCDGSAPGCAVSFDSGSVFTLVNTTLVDNMAGGVQNGINVTGSTISIQNSIIAGTVSGTIDAANSGNNLLDADKAAVAFADRASGDYRLAPASPAINAGNGTYYTEAGGNLSADTCLGGLPRLLGAAIDIGAFEYPVTIGPDETNILYVNKNVSGLVGDGSSWETAMPELADALKWAKEKYEADNTVFDTEPLKIYVAKGTYKPMYSPADNNFGNSDGRNNSFLLVNNVQLYGGFAGTETGLNGTEADLAARDFETNKTILSGDLDNNDGVDGAINGENAYHVVVSAAAVGNALLDGFVISGGNADGESMSLTVNEQSVYSDFGGGMYNVSSSPVLTNVTVSGNRAVSGGGMYNYVGSSPELINVTVSGNRAFNGGGMYNFSNSSPVLTNVTISGNRAYDGGGMFNEDSSPVLTNVTVSGNRADNDGGGMFNWNSSPVLTNVTISGNRANSRGGGMYKNASLPSTTLYNSIVWGNGTSAIIGSINESSSHNLIEGDYADYNIGDIPADLEATDIFRAPAAADGAPTTVGDYTLKAGSPAINNGDNNHYWDAVGEGNPLPDTESGWGFDLGGNPRLSGANIDLGAYERPVFEVPDAATLARIGVDPGYPSDGYYIQTADIDLSDYAVGSGWAPIGGNLAAFNGTFDGNGYTIRNLKINRPDVDFVGLFGVVGSEGLLTDIRLMDAEVTGGEAVSSLVGNLRGGTVEQVYVRGTVSAAQSNAGGLVGVNVGTIRNSAAAVHTQGQGRVGGLAGTNAGTIRNTYATGKVAGNNQVGGLVGYTPSIGTLENTYASGDVNGTVGSFQVGGLIGRSDRGAVVTASYWNTATSGMDASAGGTGKDDAGMRQQATFTDWDFTDTWAIDEGFSHPYLRWYGNPVPRVTTTSGTATFTESTQGDPVPVAVDPELTVSDADDITLASATVTIVANFQQGQDLLDFGNGSGMGNITGEYDADAGILTLTSPGGTATLAEWETALRAVTYSNPSLDPDTETRTIGFAVHDGISASNTATRAIAIVATNTAPVNSIPGSQTVDQNETLVFDTANDNALSVFDVDVGSGTIRVTLAATNGVLTLAGTTGLVFTDGDGTGDAVMTFNGTIADINEALDGLQFIPASGYNGPATLQITTDDLGHTGAGETETDTDQVDITIYPIEPVVVAAGSESTNGIFGIDDDITLTVTFDQPVTVDEAAGSPGLLLETGDTDREAMYVSGSGSHTLLFSYMVQAGDYSADLDYVVTDALALHGATIRNSRGDDAVLTLPTVGGLYSLSGQHDLVIDGVAPAAPQGLGVLFGNQQNVLDWPDPTDVNIVVYRVYGGTTALPTALLYTVLAPVTTYVHSDLANGTAYYYRITVVDGAGNESAYSDEVSATPKAPQTITFDPLPAKTYGDGDFNAGATSSNGSIAITYRSSDERVATVVDGNIHIVGAGVAILTASQAGDAGHTAASDEQQTLQVAAKRLTVTANGQHKVYGDADPDLTYIAAGFVAGDDETVLTGALERDPGADVGRYAISQGHLDAGGNYVIDFTGADFTITPRPLTVTAGNHTVLYTGSAYSGGNGVAYDGFAPGEDESVLGGSLAYSGSAQGAVKVGSYNIQPDGLTAANYTITFAGGRLDIVPTGVNVLTFDSQTAGSTVGVSYGAAPLQAAARATSGLPVSYRSSDEGVATVGADGTVTIRGVGRAAITVSQGGDVNHGAAADIGFTVEVARAPLTVTANNDTKVYDGTAYSDGNGVRYTGFVYGEDEAALEGALAYGGSSQGAVDAGTYELMPGGLASGNYKIGYVAGQLDILPAERTLTFPALPGKTYGDGDFDGGATSSGGETISYSSSNPGVAAITSDGKVRIVGAGTATITATVPENGNYVNRPEAGHVLTVNKATQSITLDAPAEVGRNGGTVLLDVSASSGLEVTLDIDDEEVAALNGTRLTILRLGTVRITATQAGDGNHEAANPVTATVRVSDPAQELPIRVSKAVSPNGDGINEYLVIEAIKDYPDNRVSIFNRNGTVVYEAGGYNNGTVAFRGVGTGQHAVPAGTYFYVAEIRVNGEWKYEKGWFVLRY